MNFPAIFKKKFDFDKDTKRRVLKNKEALLDAFGEKIEGNRACPELLGQPCIGKMCMRFMKFRDVFSQKEFWNCADVQQVYIQMELTAAIREFLAKTNKEASNEDTEKNPGNF